MNSTRNVPSPLFDTLDDLSPLSLEDSSLSGFMAMLFKGITGDEEAYGQVSTGGYSLAWPGNGEWGETVATFGQQFVYVRISPKNSRGKPLGEDEERVIKILALDDSPGAMEGTLTTFVYRKYTSAKVAEKKMNKRRDMRATAACFGVAATIIHIPEHQGTCVELESRWAGCKENVHGVFPSYEIVVSQDSSFCSFSGAIYTIAASLAGIMGWTDDPERTMISYTQEAHYRANSVTHTSQLARELNKMLKPQPYTYPNQRAAQRIYAALKLSEDNSFVGFLQTMANPVHAGALPDDFCKPDKLPLLMVASIAVATQPERYGLEHSTSGDIYAVGKLRELFREQTQRVCTDGKYVHYSIDCLIDHALFMVQSDLKKLEATPWPKAMREQRISKIRAVQNDTIHAFYRMGIGLANEVFSPKDPNSFKDLYNEYGFATNLYDPASRCDVERCADAGLSNGQSIFRIANPWDHELRVNKLIEIMMDVDNYLRCGRWKHIQILEPSGAASQQDLAVMKECATLLPEEMTLEKLIEDAAPSPDEQRKKSKKKGKHNKKAVVDRTAHDEQKMDTSLAGKKTKMNSQAVETAGRFLAKSFRLGIPMSLMTLDYTVYTASTISKNKCATCNNQATASEMMSLPLHASKCEYCHARRCLHCVTKILDAGTDSAPPTCMSCIQLANVQDASDLIRATLGINE